MELDVRIVDPDGRELHRWRNPNPIRVDDDGAWFFELWADFQGQAAAHQLVWGEQVIASANFAGMAWRTINGPSTFFLDYSIKQRRPVLGQPARTL